MMKRTDKTYAYIAVFTCFIVYTTHILVGKDQLLDSSKKEKRKKKKKKTSFSLKTSKCIHLLPINTMLVSWNLDANYGSEKKCGGPGESRSKIDHFIKDHSLRIAFTSSC